MKPTLEAGQYLVVNKLVYFKVDMQRLSRLVPFWETTGRKEFHLFNPPQRGDVVIFHAPIDLRRDFVKRVVGLPGEQVEIREQGVYVDGKLLQELYLEGLDITRLMGRLNLNEGEYFVMGDNRRGSNDSRDWGPVPIDNVIGRVWCVYWPISDMTCM